MAITTQEEKKNKIFTPTFKRNWKLFKQSTMGKVGLIIISFFGILATIQPLFFISGYWSESVYDPVVGYDPIEVTLLIVKCPKNEEYPTEKYEKPRDCPGAVSYTHLTLPTICSV